MTRLLLLALLVAGCETNFQHCVAMCDSQGSHVGEFTQTFGGYECKCEYPK